MGSSAFAPPRPRASGGAVATASPTATTNISYPFAGHAWPAAPGGQLSGTPAGLAPRLPSSPLARGAAPPGWTGAAGAGSPAYLSWLRAEPAAAAQRELKKAEAEARVRAPAPATVARAATIGEPSLVGAAAAAASGVDARRRAPANAAAGSADRRGIVSAGRQGVPAAAPHLQLGMPEADASRTLRQNADGSWAHDGVGWQIGAGSGPAAAGPAAAGPAAAWPAAAWPSRQTSLVEHVPVSSTPQMRAGMQGWPQPPALGGWQAWRPPTFTPAAISLAGMQAFGLPGPGPAGGPEAG